jgi:Domain of unknown function (DUF4268)
MTRLWKVESGQLAEVAAASPKWERTIEDWIAGDPSILGLDLLIIARQLTTDFGGRIDLLGIDRAGDLTLIEMKRDRTPREVISQTLDYGSWVKGLTTPRIHGIANTYLKRPLSEAFHHRFDQNIPETLNSSHNLLIVASGFDPSSRRIVEYLAETHGVSINTAFFSYFHDGDNEFLASDFLLDQEQVVERSESRTKGSDLIGKLQLEYWTEFRRYMEEHPGNVRPRLTPQPNNSMAFSAGRSGFTIVTTINIRGKRISVYMLISGPNAKPCYYLLHDEKEEIEKEFGEKLDWRERPGQVESHVWLVLEPADPSDRSDWPRQHAWLRDRLERFRAVFRPRVRQLDPAAWVAEPEGTTELEPA